MAYKLQLRRLLYNYQDMFALKGQRLGHTNVVQHHIGTGDKNPICQAPRRIPIHQVHAVEEAMEKSDVIQPSDVGKATW